jgi:hypothetical protein
LSDGDCFNHLINNSYQHRMRFDGSTLSTPEAKPYAAGV